MIWQVEQLQPHGEDVSSSFLSCVFSVIVDNGGGREKEKKKKTKKQIREELPSIHARHTVTAVWEVVFPSESGKMMSSPVGLLLFLLFLFHIYYLYRNTLFESRAEQSQNVSVCLCGNRENTFLSFSTCFFRSFSSIQRDQHVCQKLSLREKQKGEISRLSSS